MWPKSVLSHSTKGMSFDIRSFKRSSRRTNRWKVFTPAAGRVEDLLRRSFQKCRELDRNARPDAFLIPIGEEAFRALQRLRFSAEIESRLRSSLSRLYQGGIVDNKELLLQYRDRGI